jgi:glutamine---fructose-6-phosphate transaminase (isomerizing)
MNSAEVSMCGIVGYVGNKKAVPVLMDALRRLEYRGYDSAGIAVSGNGGGLQIRRAEGKLINLEEVIRLQPLEGTYGIGHTRWATHGRPSEQNAHPHRDCTHHVVVVHNGIVENYLALKQRLGLEGHTFTTDTDTEIIAHLVEKHRQHGEPLEQAVADALMEITGVFAIAVIAEDEPGKIVAARNGPPAVIGMGRNEYFLASDVPAILNHTREVFFLSDGDLAVLTSAGVDVSSFGGHPLERSVQHINWDPEMAEKGGFRHFMLKEIFEQPRAVQETTLGRVSAESGEIFLHELKISEAKLRTVKKINIAACGTSWHAGLAGKYMIERLVRLPVEIDFASEFRYREPILDNNSLTLVITQSGETADTIAALREAKTQGSPTLAICNVVGSMATREADGIVYTRAGPEIGVASTKAFTAQLTALFLFALYLARLRTTLAPDEATSYVNQLAQLPAKLEFLLAHEEAVECLATEYQRSKDFLFLGRGIHYPIALEGALKLKEISYIHAEGYPAGEMKHGPNALIDDSLPVVIIATRDANDVRSAVRYEKALSNLKEVKARSGRVIAIATEGDNDIQDSADDTLFVPAAPELLSPILEIVPLQLLAYHIAVRRGCDVDQPRNLAKSVTVE